MRKAIGVLAVVGLTNALNLRQIKDHGLSEFDHANDQFLDLGSLIKAGVQTVGDAKKHEKSGAKAAQLIKDGLKILGDIAQNNGKGDNQSSNEEEAFEFLDLGSLIQDGKQTVGDAKKHEKKGAKAAQLIKDGLKILGDIAQNNGEEDNHGANEEEDFEFLDLGSLIKAGKQTVSDAKKHEKKGAKAAQLLKDGLKIIGDIAQNNGEEDNHGANEEEALEFLELGSLIQDGKQAVGDAKKHEKKGAKAAQLLKDGLKILGDIAQNNGEEDNHGANEEEDIQFFDSGMIIDDYEFRATGKTFAF